MGFFKNDKIGKPPHTWYPDILHWREGDKIFCWNVGKAIGYMKARQADLYKYMEGVNHVTPYGKGMFNYKSVDEQGNIYLDGNLVNDAEEVGVGLGAILQDVVLNSQRHVQVRCDSEQTKDVFEPVLRAIAEAGGIVEAVGELE